MPFVEPSKTPIEALQQPVNPFEPRSGLILSARGARRTRSRGGCPQGKEPGEGTPETKVGGFL